MVAPEDALRERLVDPDFWRSRLEALRRVPRHLTQIPRADLSRPGIDVVELRLKAHDRTPLSGLAARSTFHRRGCPIHLRICEALTNCAIDYFAVESGWCDVVFPFPEEHRLEDRVVDVLRLADAAGSLQDLPAQRVELYSGHRPPPQEFVIADLLRERGLV